MPKNLIKDFRGFVNENYEEEADIFGAQDMDMEPKESEETENYMFFGDLETIKRNVEELLTMDQVKVDQILKNGHNWAVDHIVSSKDDIEEVFNFLKNEIENEGSSKEDMITDDSESSTDN